MKEILESFVVVAALIVSIYWLVEPFIKSNGDRNKRCNCR